MSPIMEMALAKARQRAVDNLRRFAAHMDAHEQCGLTFQTCPFCLPPPRSRP